MLEWSACRGEEIFDRTGSRGRFFGKAFHDNVNIFQLSFANLSDRFEIHSKKGFNSVTKERVKIICAFMTLPADTHQTFARNPPGGKTIQL